MTEQPFPRLTWNLCSAGSQLQGVKSAGTEGTRTLAEQGQEPHGFLARWSVTQRALNSRLQARIHRQGPGQTGHVTHRSQGTTASQPLLREGSPRGAVEDRLLGDGAPTDRRAGGCSLSSCKQGCAGTKDRSETDKL